MAFSLRNANIVVLAHTYNPSIVSKEWLKQKSIIVEEAIKFTHTPVFSFVETDNLTLIVDTDRLQVLAKNSAIENINGLPKIAENFISNLPETPYTAMGFNFVFQLEGIKNNFKEIFKNDDSKFRTLFSLDYTLGGIIQFKFLELIARLQLLNFEGNTIVADYNFHYNSNQLIKINEMLRKYPEVKAKAELILKELFYA